MDEMEIVVHAEGRGVSGRDVVVRYELSVEEVDFLFRVDENDYLELGAGDYERFIELFGEGWVKLDKSTPSEYGDAYLSDIGLHYLNELAK